MTEPGKADLGNGGAGANEPGEGDEGTETYSKAEVDKIIDETIKGDANYKGMQRAMSKLDRDSKQALAERDAQLAQTQGELQNASQGLNFLQKKWLEGLDEDERAGVLAELQEQRILRVENNQRVLSRNQMARTAPAPVDQGPRW